MNGKKGKKMTIAVTLIAISLRGKMQKTNMTRWSKNPK